MPLKETLATLDDDGLYYYAAQHPEAELKLKLSRGEGIIYFHESKKERGLFVLVFVKQLCYYCKFPHQQPVTVCVLASRL